MLDGCLMAFHRHLSVSLMSVAPQQRLPFSPSPSPPMSKLYVGGRTDGRLRKEWARCHCCDKEMKSRRVADGYICANGNKNTQWRRWGGVGLTHPPPSIQSVSPPFHVLLQARKRPTDRWKANGFWFGLVHFKSTQGRTTNNNNIMWLSFSFATLC